MIRKAKPSDTPKIAELCYIIWSEFELVDKQIKNEDFGVLTFKATTYKQDKSVVIKHIDKLYCGRKH